MSNPVVRILVFLLACAALAAGSSGASSFVVERLAPGVEVPPAVYFGMVLALCVPLLRPLPRHTWVLFLGFAVLTAWFCLSSVWANSVVYRDDKLLRSAVSPPILLLAAYLVGRRGAVDYFVAAAAAFALMIAVAVFSGGSDVLGSLEALLVGEAVKLDYQRFSIICGAGAAVLIPVLNRRTILWGAGALALALCAFMSGGRTGVLLVGVGLLTRLSLSVSPRILIPTTVAALVAGFVLLNPLLDVATSLAESAGAPETMLRALYAAAEPPAITRVWNRPEFLAAAIQAWLANPIIGVGWGGYPPAAGLPDQLGFYPHNVVAELLAETGLIGLTAAGAWFLAALKTVARIPAKPTERPYVAAIWSLILCGVVVSMFVGDWATHHLLFLGIGLGLGAYDSAWLSSNLRRTPADPSSGIQHSATIR